MRKRLVLSEATTCVSLKGPAVSVCAIASTGLPRAITYPNTRLIGCLRPLCPARIAYLPLVISDRIRTCTAIHAGAETKTGQRTDAFRGSMLSCPEIDAGRLSVPRQRDIAGRSTKSTVGTGSAVVKISSRLFCPGNRTAGRFPASWREAARSECCP